MPTTIAENLDRPFVSFRDASHIRLGLTVARLNTYMQNDQDSCRTPEYDALNFYLLNHGFSLLQQRYHRNEPLGKDAELADRYFTTVADATQRAFYYLLLICTRESRHQKGGGSYSQQFQSKFGGAIYSFWCSIKGVNSHSAALKLRQSPPDCSLGEYTESLVWGFYNGSYSGGFGGPAWGAVADCLHAFVTGKYSAEMMLDTVWTLCHNNGPIFNKGMLYETYSSDLKTILDVQRSGQIPQLVRDHATGTKYISKISKEQEDLNQLLLARFPELDTFICWDTVEALGSVHQYHGFKTTQHSKFGMSPKVAEAVKIAEKKEAAEAAAKEKSAKEEADKFFFIAPGQKVKKVKREELVNA